MQETEAQEDAPAVTEEDGHDSLVTHIVWFAVSASDLPRDQPKQQGDHPSQDHGKDFVGDQFHDGRLFSSDVPTLR